MAKIIVPNVGESVSSGIIAAWMKKDGDPVSEGDILFELETDKATMEVPATASGVLKISVSPGTEVEVGSEVGEIAPVSGAAAAGSANTSPAPQAAESSTDTAGKQADKAAKATADAPPASVSGAGSAAAATPDAPAKAAPSAAPAARTLDDLSPAVRRLVEELQLDPASLKAADPSGRLSKEDVIRQVQTALSAAAGGSAGQGSSASRDGAGGGQTRTQQPLAGDADGGRQQRQPMTNLRKRIAERLVESKQTSAHLTTFNEVDMQAVMEMRKSYKDSFEKKHGIRLGFMSIFVKAAVKALQEYPDVNAFVDRTDIIYNNFYDIGVALSSDRGLMTPVIRDADRLGFADIEKRIADFIQRAQNKKIMPDELMGGTFTISNGGVFGSMLSTPIPNPPQTAVLGMHSIQERPVVRNGEIVIRPMMYLALTYDHRILDGREAIGFLKSIKESVEDPRNLLLDV